MQLSDSARKTLIAKVIADDYSRNILIAITSKPMSIEQICIEQGIPVSSCYRIMRDLEACRIVKKHKILVSERGKKSGLYVSILKRATVSFESGKFSVEVLEDETAENPWSKGMPYLRTTKLNEESSILA
ncbi:MAG: winged helix-turn-helix domain-containing protein [Nitrososphaerales archaeon]